MFYGIRSDIYEAGRDECGGIIEGLVYYIVAETESGRRFAHFMSFTDRGVRGQGEARAQCLLDNILAKKASHEITFRTLLAAGVVPEYWSEIDPAYGSDAYQGLDNERYFRNREIMEAHDAGEISENEASRLMMR